MKLRIEMKSALAGFGTGILLTALIAIAIARLHPRPPTVSAKPAGLPELTLPTGGQATGLEPAAHEFGQGPNRRIWRPVDANTWEEIYPDGAISEFKVVGRTNVAGSMGTVMKNVSGDFAHTGTPNDGSFEVFIPDKGSAVMHHWFRNTQWHDNQKEMKAIQ